MKKYFLDLVYLYLIIQIRSVIHFTNFVQYLAICDRKHVTISMLKMVFLTLCATNVTQ